MKEMRELTEEEKLKFIADAKAKNNKKLQRTLKCTCGEIPFGSHWCEKCQVFTGGLRR